MNERRKKSVLLEELPHGGYHVSAFPDGASGATGRLDEALNILLEILGEGDESEAPPAPHQQP